MEPNQSLTIEASPQLLDTIEGMARYEGQTIEEFALDSLKAHIEGILDNPRICGDGLTDELRKTYGLNR
jgi:hypothetical protein